MSDERGVVKYQAKDGNEVALSFDTIRKFLVHGKPEFVTNQEMIFFMGICKARGLNPFAKDCYLMKYTSNDPAAIITSIDYFRARAKAQADCKGWKAGIIVQDKDGNVKRSSGLLLENEKLIGGWFSAKPGGWEEPFELEVNLKPYIKTRQDGQPTRFWQTDNQPTMIRKVAESQGLREVWPSEFAKLYVEEEVDAGAVMDAAFTVKEDALTEKIKQGKEAAPGPEVSQWICAVCGYVCASEKGYKKHMTMSHPITKADAGENTKAQEIVETVANAEAKKPIAPEDIGDDEETVFLKEAGTYYDLLFESGEWAKVMEEFKVENASEISTTMRTAFIRTCKSRLDVLNAKEKKEK